MGTIVSKTQNPQMYSFNDNGKTNHSWDISRALTVHNNSIHSVLTFNALE